MPVVGGARRRALGEAARAQPARHGLARQPDLLRDSRRAEALPGQRQRPPRSARAPGARRLGLQLLGRRRAAAGATGDGGRVAVAAGTGASRHGGRACRPRVCAAAVVPVDGLSPPRGARCGAVAPAAPAPRPRSAPGGSGPRPAPHRARLVARPRRRPRPGRELITSTPGCSRSHRAKRVRLSGRGADLDRPVALQIHQDRAPAPPRRQDQSSTPSTRGVGTAASGSAVVSRRRVSGLTRQTQVGDQARAGLTAEHQADRQVEGAQPRAPARAWRRRGPGTARRRSARGQVGASQQKRRVCRSSRTATPCQGRSAIMWTMQCVGARRSWRLSAQLRARRKEGKRCTSNA